MKDGGVESMIFVLFLQFGTSLRITKQKKMCRGEKTMFNETGITPSHESRRLPAKCNYVWI